ncbi:fasciclin domain-containing protein [Chitinophaga oryziterrae]|uniref:Fasciclin domain-containing protein n=1 Tax=Chitinophaga oryziterrae TaxID=1031224 RepID=A0A6N8J3T9_9BACT|nr:fasciclin domain-containing protein [Chitinophaga oryziterrae]MVT39867.1 fasciclin domain-containing protein [Chitinophaga oryziterrae]
MKRAIYIAMLFLAACKKDDTAQPDNSANRISYVIADNLFNFSSFNTVLERTGYIKKLSGDGPFTVLVPDNNAFIKAGYANSDAVRIESGTVLNNIVSYHILSGTWELNKLPYTFNQELTTDAGAKMYVTHWVKNADTVVTINGTRVLAYNLAAENGLIQVMDAVLQPLVNASLSDAIAADTALTFLNVALQQADMKTMLAGSDVYTVLAPSNNAFRKMGYSSIDSVNATSPAILKDMLYYTMFQGRKFIYDYILTTDATDKSQQSMLNGNNITVRLIKTGVQYTGVTLQGSGNTGTINVIKSNVLTGNGVLHTIDQVLRVNQ